MNEIQRKPDEDTVVTEEELDEDYPVITFDIRQYQLEGEANPLSSMRAQIREFLISVECSDDVVEFGTLILHELCANAAAQSEATKISLALVESGVFLSATDQAGDAQKVERRLRAQQHMDNDQATRGRGLPMVAAMCRRFRERRGDEIVNGVCGVEVLPDGGKQVWAYLPKNAELVTDVDLDLLADTPDIEP